jgi:tetratricopeptide (TPR) repeat protein
MVRIKWSLLLAFAFLCLPVAARAQDDPPPPPKAQPKVQSGPVGPAAPAFQIPTDPRERRAAAYGKLLEAQRLYFTIRRSNNEAANSLLLAQIRNALDQAIQIDPTLAEAFTLRAELAFYYPPTDWAEAERLAKRSLAANPDNLGARRVLARLYTVQSGLGRKAVDQAVAERAIVQLRELTRLNAADMESWALLSEFYEQSGRSAEAMAAMQSWSSSPQSSEPYFYENILRNHKLTTDAALARLGAALVRSGDAAGAIEPIIRAISLNPGTDEYVDLLQTAIDESGTDANAILGELQRLTLTNPDSTDLVRVLAATQARGGHLNEAVATIRQTLARVDRDEDNQESWGLRASLAEIYVDAGDHAGAVAVYQELLQRAGIGEAPLASDSDREIAADLLPRIVTVQKNAGDFAGAERTIQRMRLLFGPLDSTAEEQTIALLRDQHKFAEALAAVRAARIKYPDAAGLVRLESGILTDSGKVTEAVALLRAQIPKTVDTTQPPNQNDFILLLTISSHLSQAGKSALAVAAAKDALTRAPASSPGFTTAALLTLSSAQQRAGDFKGAQESLQRILDRDPDNATALNNFAYFLAERGERLADALVMIKRAVRTDPKNSSYLDSLGWVYFKLGKLDRAERYLTDALRRDPTSFTLNEHLGDVYHGQNKPDQARAAWQRALSASIVTDDVAGVKAKINGRAKQ